MLTTGKFKKEYRCFKKGETVEFRPGVNLLVGDQGTGKSSLLQLIGQLGKGGREREKAEEAFELKTDGAVRLLYFDFEKDTPRNRGFFDDRQDFGVQIASRFMSHGEVINGVHREVYALRTKKDPYAFALDEPDTGLSPRSVYALVRQLDKLSKKHQILAAVHNPIIITSQPELFSLEHRKWMPSAEFLEEMKKPRAENPNA